MKRTSIGITVGVLMLMVVGIVAFVFNSGYKGEEVTMFTDEQVAESASAEELSKERKLELNTIEVSGSDVLLTYMSAREYEDYMFKLEGLFDQVIDEFIAIDIDLSAYYEQNKDYINQATGLTTEDQFIQFYNKIIVLPNYEKCDIMINEESFKADGVSCYYDMSVIFDETIEMQFYGSFDKKTLTYKIF